MSKEVIKKIAESLSNSRPVNHLAKVKAQKVSKYALDIEFLAPSSLEGLILEEVPVLRGGVGFLPSVGSEVFISFIGVDYMPFVLGVWESGKKSGIENGGEISLGDILVIENGKIRIENKVANLGEILEDMYQKIGKLATTPCVQGSQLAPEYSAQVVVEIQKVKGLLG